MSFCYFLISFLNRAQAAVPLRLLYVARTSKSTACRNLTKNNRICMVSLCTMSVLAVFDSWSVRVALMFTFTWYPEAELRNRTVRNSGTEIELHRPCEKKTQQILLEGRESRGRVEQASRKRVPEKENARAPCEIPGSFSTYNI